MRIYLTVLLLIFCSQVNSHSLLEVNDSGCFFHAPYLIDDVSLDTMLPATECNATRLPDGKVFGFASVITEMSDEVRNGIGLASGVTAVSVNASESGEPGNLSIEDETFICPNWAAHHELVDESTPDNKWSAEVKVWTYQHNCVLVE